MKTNVQITAVKKEFKSGQNGYEVKVEGMDGKLDCKMNFHEPLKAMRYMFLLSKRLELQIDSIQLAALSLAYQRAKEAEQKAVEDAASVISEVGDAEQDADNSSPSEGTEKLPLFPFYRRGQASLSGVYEAFWLRCVVRVKSKNRPREGLGTLPNGFLGDVLADM